MLRSAPIRPLCKMCRAVHCRLWTLCILTSFRIYLYFDLSMVTLVVRSEALPAWLVSLAPMSRARAIFSSACNGPLCCC
jgi:hypothetical protein